MANIQQALGQLFQSLESLEEAARLQEQKAYQVQQDLFNSRAAKPSNVIKLADPSVLAQKLDGAISKIEQVLREG